MKRYSLYGIVLALVAGLWACGGKDPDPQAQLPGYLRIPATLTGYEGSGLITVDGALSLRAEGSEVQNATNKTYTGVQGSINSGFKANFTVGQPLPYKQNGTVPDEYQSNGQLVLINTIDVGTYPMGFESKPTPIGAAADLTLNLPGPQLYTARLGTITITESTLIKSEGGSSLYRIQGSFQTALFGIGVGAPSDKDYNVTGTFDLLLRN